MRSPAFLLPFFTVMLLVSGCNRTGRTELPAEPALASGEVTANLNGLKLWFRVSGSGPICVMPSPAWGPSSDLYFRTLKPMEKFFTIVYLDSRGTGRSEHAKGTTDYTWNHLVADLDALRIHLKQEKVWMMGHSEGGIQVLHYAAAYPDRVNGLVLLDAAAASDAESEADLQSRLNRRQDRPWFAEAMKAQSAPAPTDAAMAANMTKMLPLYWSDPAKIEKYEADFTATSMSAEALKGQDDSKRYPYDLRESLKRVTAPALIVVGDDDFISSPFAARRIHLSLPNSKLLLIEKSGHFPWLEQPETFNAQVPLFLASLGIRPTSN